MTKSKKYENVKASLKAELGDKFPKNMNGLTDEFICKTFLPKLEKSDMVEIATKRKELKASNEKGNWFPAFRSWVGKTYFEDEFGAKKSNKVKTDEIGNFLDELLASLGD